MPYADAADVDRAVAAAHAAFLKWRDVPVVDRVQVLYRYKTLLEKHADELAAHPDARKRQDARRCQAGSAPRHPDGGSGVRHAQPDDGRFAQRRRRRHRLQDHPPAASACAPASRRSISRPWCRCGCIPFAIACGNTFILKPSEKVPLTPTRAVELLHDAGLPAGVFNLMHGDKVAVDALLHHPLVQGRLVRRLDARWRSTSTPPRPREGKRVQALGGAKNHLVVMPDADMPKTVEAIIGSAFGAAGERCLAGSVLVPVGDAAESAARAAGRSAPRI